MAQRTDIRISLPSKGRLADDAVTFLAMCGLKIHKPNPRQYAASIPVLPNVTVLYQRPSDIVVSVRDGSVDFGITGMDVTKEYGGTAQDILILHEALGFGSCRLAVAVPEAWENVTTVNALREYAQTLPHQLRIATKFTNLADRFFKAKNIHPFSLVHAEGTLEVAPAIGHADCIVDLVSSGQTLRDNRLRMLEDGVILHSQAALIANHAAVQQRPDVLAIARTLLELTEANLRAQEHVLVVANMRGASPETIAQAMVTQDVLSGLQGPTISPVVVEGSTENGWYAVQIVVRRDRLIQAIAELRAIGGSGVVVTPVTYIFEEEPERISAMMAAVRKD